MRRHFFALACALAVTVVCMHPALACGPVGANPQGEGGAIPCSPPPGPAPMDANVTITAPNGGETLQAGSYYAITWTVSPAAVPPLTVYLKYTMDGFPGTQKFNVFPSGPSMVIDNGTYLWTVPNSPSTDCYLNITVIDSAATTMYGFDDSDGAFTILAAPIQFSFTNPQQNQNLTAGYQITVSWSASGGFGTLKTSLFYTLDGKATWGGIKQNITGSTQWTWTVPDPGTRRDDCHLWAKVNDSSTPPLSQDFYVGNFTIYKPPPQPLEIAITSPSGGEVWPAESDQQILWTVSGGVPTYTVKLEYSTTGLAGPWIVLTTTGTGGVFNWHLPDLSSTANNSFVRATVTDSLPQSKETISGAAFTISVPAPPTVRITSPNGGEVWGTNLTKYISWVLGGESAPIKIKISYSTSGLTGTFTEITTIADASIGGYSWTIPDIAASTNCFIKAEVEDSFKTKRTAQDTSDAAFSIVRTPPKLVVAVTAPKTGDRWNSGSNYDITWSRAGGQAPYSISIEYSSDGLATFRTITNSADDGGASSVYTWNVPQTPSTNCYVRVIVHDNLQTTTATSGKFEIVYTTGTGKGSIKGQVYLDNNRPASGATVVVLEDTSLKATVDDSGMFTITNVNIGLHSIKIVLSGYSDQTINGIEVKKDQATDVGSVTLSKIRETMPFWMLLLIILMILLVVGGLVGFVVMRYRRKQAELAKKPEHVWVDASWYANQPPPQDYETKNIGALPTETRRVQAAPVVVDKEAELARLEEMKQKGLVSDDEYELSRENIVSDGAATAAIESSAQPQQAAQPESPATEADAQKAREDEIMQKHVDEVMAQEESDQADEEQADADDEAEALDEEEAQAAEDEDEKSPEEIEAEKSGDVVALALARAERLKKKGK